MPVPGRHARPRSRSALRRRALPAVLAVSAAAAPLALITPAQAAPLPAAGKAAPLPPPVTPPQFLRGFKLAAQFRLARKLTPATYTVARGDTLSGIAARFCGTASAWPRLYGANVKVIGANPNAITAGEKLALDCHHAALNVVVAAAQPAHVVTTAVAEVSPVTATVSGGTLSFAGLEALWESADGPAYAAYQAAEVAECESGGRQYAYNPSGASGYWQILGSVVPGNIFDPIVNALNAVSKWRSGGGPGDRDSFAQWVCQP
jgi:LysM domain-containing protein